MIQLPQTFHREHVASPIGGVVVLTDDAGILRAVDFDDYAERMHRLLDRHYGRGRWTLAKAGTASAARLALEAYFAGEIGAIETVPSETNGSAFQRRIWTALRAIRAGTTQSYGGLAVAIGQRSAVRAVGLANGANPVAVVVPCHRVIGSSGALTGYGGGLERKRWLLDHEARHLGGFSLARSG